MRNRFWRSIILCIVGFKKEAADMFRTTTIIGVAVAFIGLAVIPAGADPYPSQWRKAHVRHRHTKLSRWMLSHPAKKHRREFRHVKPRPSVKQPLAALGDARLGSSITPSPFTPDLSRRGAPFGPPTVGGIGNFANSGNPPQPMDSLPAPGAGLLALLGLTLVTRVARRNT